MRNLTGAVAALLALAGASSAAAEDGAPVVPATRADLKRALEDSKRSVPRLPLPPLTADQEAKASAGDWGVVNNGRMRSFYLPPELTASGLSRGAEPGMSLGYPFQTMLFWLVSRANNCTYCMGHQESKLAAAGVAEEAVAGLDGDWSGYTPAERSAFRLARALTVAPQDVTAADLEALRPFHDDKQMLEVVFVTANFNAMNRWTGALKIPQEAHREYLTPTPARFLTLRSAVAPLPTGAPSSTPVCAAPSPRPAPPTRPEIERAFRGAAGRAPRLPLVGESEAAALLPAGVSFGDGPLPQWVRLLANFPKGGMGRAAVHVASATKGKLDPTLRASIAWVAAREDRAWYALGLARERLLALGLSDDAIYALGEDPDAPPATRAALAFARKLTVDPALITDADVAGLRALFSDREVAEVVWHVTEAAFFDRLTEAAGLRVGE